MCVPGVTSGGARSSGSGSSGGRPSIARSIATSRRAASDGGGAGWQVGSEAGRGMADRMLVKKSAAHAHSIAPSRCSIPDILFLISDISAFFGPRAAFLRGADKKEDLPDFQNLAGL